MKNARRIKDRVLFSIYAKDMTKEDWLEAWKSNPHWADSLEPSKGAIRFSEVLKKDNPQGKVLEIGCGNGRDANYFSENGFEVVAIDLSPDAVALAKKNFETSEHLSFQVGDAENLKFRDNVFDAIYSWSVLHSTEMKKSFKEVSRVLKSGGLLNIYLYIKTDYFESDDSHIRTEVNFKVSELVKILKENNFSPLEHPIVLRSTDDDEYGKHTHLIIIYLLRSKK